MNKLSYNIVRWHKVKTAKHKILIFCVKFCALLSHSYRILNMLQFVCSEKILLCYLPFSSYGYSVARSMKIVAISRLTPKRRNSGSRMDVEAMVGGIDRIRCLQKLTQKLEFCASHFFPSATRLYCSSTLFCSSWKTVVSGVSNNSLYGFLVRFLSLWFYLFYK